MIPLHVGVLGCSSFARRAMIPALVQSGVAQCVAVASRSHEKAAETAAPFGAEAVCGYERLIERADIDAIYVPLPTGLHAEWCTRALEAGKHLLVEKTFASNAAEAAAMLALARRQNLLAMENFQFQTHSQWSRFRSFMDSGEIGHVHLVRSTFGFPPLPRENFRWNAALGGGALLDTGAYMAKVSQLLLGPDLEVRGASAIMDAATGVDSHGEAQFRNARGQVAQVAWGFDYFYQCRAELLGTKGKVSLGRVFTAPPDFAPVLCIETPEGVRNETLPADNHYINMWRRFAGAIANGDHAAHWDAIESQARLLDAIRAAVRA